MAFTIRGEQARALDEASFADYMVQHLKQFSPLHAQVLADDGLRGMIRLGRERAGQYGLTRRGPLQFFIELLFILGVDFDTDPQYPWVGPLLRDAATEDQTVRAEKLYDRVMEYLIVATGKHREFARRALLQARQLPYEGPALASSTFESEVLRTMRELHRERYDYVGEPPLRALIAAGRVEAGKFLVDSDAGVTLIIALMFVLGHGVTRDPKYAFVAATLTNDSIPTPNQRAERLYSKTMTYLDHAIQARG